MHNRNYVRILRRLWITLEQMRQEKIILKEKNDNASHFPMVLTIRTMKINNNQAVGICHQL